MELPLLSVQEAQAQGEEPGPITIGSCTQLTRDSREERVLDD
jgi:hypothetical protein